MKATQCPKCLQTFSRISVVSKHLKKKIPCDYRCLICETSTGSATAYKKHILICKEKQLEQKRQGKEDEILELIPITQKADDGIENEERIQMIPIIDEERYLVSVPNNDQLPVPLQDFDLSWLKNVGLTMADIELEYYQRKKIKHTGNIANSGMYLNRDTHVQEQLVIRLKKDRLMDARQPITKDMIYGVMCCLVPDIEPDHLRRLATDMLYDALRNDDPRKHNICLSDVNRGTVKMYTRMGDTNECKWVTHPKPIATKLLNEHARNLFAFLLETGTNGLVSAIWNKNPCLVLNNEYEWTVILYADRTGLLKAQKAKTTAVEYVNEDRSALMIQVKTRKDDVIQQLHNLMINDKDLTNCLQECRRFAFETMRKTNK